MTLQAKLRMAPYFAVVFGLLLGAAVMAQHKGAAPDDSRRGGRPAEAGSPGPSAPSARKAPGFSDLKPGLVETLREHGSLEIQHAGGISVRIVVEDLEDLERASPMLERLFELLGREGLNIGWIDRDEELREKARSESGQWPNPLEVSQESRLRDVERKLDRVSKDLEGSKHGGTR